MEIRDRDAERFENNSAEKNEPGRHQQTGEQAEKRLMFAMFARRARPEPQENRDQSDRVDRDKKRNKREQKFLDHNFVLALPIKPSTQSSLLPATNPVRMTTLSLLHPSLPLPLPLTLSLTLALVVDLHAENLKTVDDFRAAAAKTNAVLTIPNWEQTPEAVDAMMKNAIATANKALDQIGAQDLSKVTFKSTIVALDDLTYQAANAANTPVIIKKNNTHEKIHTTPANRVKKF